jgi:hypothetical protein
MSFLVTWSRRAHDQMGALIRAWPSRRNEFASALRRISVDLQHRRCYKASPEKAQIESGSSAN